MSAQMCEGGGVAIACTRRASCREVGELGRYLCGWCARKHGAKAVEMLGSGVIGANGKALKHHTGRGAISLSVKLYTALREYCAAADVPMSNVVEDVVNDAIDRAEATEPDR